MSTTYQYSIANDFPGGDVNTARLINELRKGIPSNLVEKVDTVEDAIYLVFPTDLTSGEKTTLDNDQTNPAGGLIADHDNSALPEDSFSASETVMGNCTSFYHVEAEPLDKEVQYTMVVLPAGSYTKMKVWVTVGETGTNIYTGVYSNENNAPSTKLVEGSYAVTTESNQFIEISLDSTYVQNAIDKVWLAMISTPSGPKFCQFAATEVLLSTFHPVAFETLADYNLPATATPEADASGSAFYVSIL
jgi:hypothetical protein